MDGTVSTSSHWKKIGAEFLAIFAGVVLGLLANSWRQAHEDRVQESFALQEMVADLQADSAELAAIDRRARQWDSAGLWVARHRGVAVPGDSAVKAVAPLFHTFVYRPQRAAYVGLRDAAELGLVRDRALRRQVVDYFETQQAYVESLYQGVGKIFSEAEVATRRYFRLTVPTGARSLRDHTSFELLRPWAEASKDQEFTAALVWLGVAGATEALRFQPVRKANAALLKAIREDNQ